MHRVHHLRAANTGSVTVSRPVTGDTPLLSRYLAVASTFLLTRKWHKTRTIRDASREKEQGYRANVTYGVPLK